jgi:acetyl-CoA carboxylase biotin carboxyl carrier protein
MTNNNVQTAEPVVALMPADRIRELADADPEGEPAVPAGRIQVKAPLVGTFYQATGPGAPPLVELGQIVEVGQQLAIIEAMKLMNPINADCRGRVTAAHVADGASVEFDQPLFDLEPLDEI